MKKQRGSVLMVSLVILTMLTLLGFGAIQASILEEKISKSMEMHMEDFQQAESSLLDAWFRYGGTATTGTDALGTDWETTLWESTDFWTVHVARTTRDTVTLHQFLRDLDIPLAIDGAISCYNGCTIDLNGNVHVDGRDHTMAPWSCSGPGCDPTLGGSEPDIPAVYQHTGGSVVTGGSVSMEGATPLVQTSGGSFTTAQWATLITLLMEQAHGMNGTAWGTRTDPTIHIVNVNMLINGNTDSAGILIVDGAEVTFNGDFRFDGLILVRDSVINLGGGVNVCGAIVAVDEDSSINAPGAGTPAVRYCSDALDMAGATDTAARLAWAHER